MARAILLLALLMGLASCASISEDACRAGNWNALGFADGTKGKPADIIGEYAEACAEFGIAPDPAAYAAGRNEGLKTYCTPANAYLVGRRGKRIAPVCSADATLAMQPANRHGLRYHEVQEDIDAVKERISERRAVLNANYSGTLTEQQKAEARRIRSEIRSLDHELFLLGIDERRYSRWP